MNKVIQTLNGMVSSIIKSVMYYLLQLVRTKIEIMLQEIPMVLLRMMKHLEDLQHGMSFYKLKQMHLILYCIVIAAVELRQDG